MSESPKIEVQGNDALSKKSSVLLAVTIIIAYICWGLTMSLQAPLFPTEAEKKGATATEV